MPAKFNISDIRSRFPSLNGEQVFFDNAGGSQTLGDVTDTISAYLKKTNVQLGASYPIGLLSNDINDNAKNIGAKFINATPDEIAFGSSTTQLLRNLSLTLYEHLTPGSEIILSKLEHEANVASWLQMAAWRDLKIVWWSSNDNDNPKLEADDLKGLLTERTKLVACTHTSNILGSIHDIKKIAQTVHSIPGALLCVDGVAFAPHRQIDIQELGVDFYSFSWYKVFGPHLAMMYAKKSVHSKLRSIGHYFKDSTNLDNMLGLAAGSYELVAAVPAVCKYLMDIPWSETAAHEELLQGILLDYLKNNSKVRILGEKSASSTVRVPVISFVVQGWKSQDIVETVEKKSNYGFRFGSFYANRLVEQVLGLDQWDGVVRASFVHYNTEEEVRGYIKVLDEVIKSK